MRLLEEGARLAGSRRQLEGAFDVVAAEMDISDSTVRDAYYEFKALIETYPEQNILSKTR